MRLQKQACHTIKDLGGNCAGGTRLGASLPRVSDGFSSKLRYASRSLLSLLPLALFLFSACSALAEEFKVGAILNLSGYGARWGENAKRGILLAQEEKNAEGGIAGQQISIVFEDARSGNLTSAAVAAQKLISVDRVQAILTQWTAETEVVWAIAMRAGIPVISTSAGAPNLVQGRPFLLRTWGDDSALIAQIVRSISDKGLERPIVLVGQDPYFIELAKELRRMLSDSGKSLAAEFEIQMEESDLRGAALRAKATRPDAVISLIPYAQQAALLRSLSHLELKPSAIFGILGSDDDSFLALAGPAAEGLLIPTYRSLSKNFSLRFRARWSEEPWLAADTSYDALLVLAEAARHGARGLALFDALMSTENFDGASGIITIMQNGERAPRETYVLKVTKGSFLPVY